MSQKKKLTKKELETALASGQITYRDPKVKNRKGYEVRIESGFEVTDSYPGFLDHPSPEGTISYVKNVDISDLATVWQAIANEQYAQGGIPRWLRDSLSDLDISVYWQIAHYQMVWGGVAHMSLKTLSRNLAVYYRSIQRSVHKLLDVGAVVLVRKNSGRRPAAYRVVLLSSLQQRLPVETTSQDVETTEESRRDDNPVVQKTNPLKGFVARTPAEAGRATPHKKKSVGLLTIDEDRKVRAKSIASKEVATKPQLIRPFFPNEANNKKIQEVLGVELLAQKWEVVKGAAKVSGHLDLATETFIPAPLADDSTLMKEVQARLTNKNNFDVRNLAQAVESVLDSILRSLTPRRKELETKLANFQHQKKREAEIEAVKQKEQERLDEKKRIEEAERFDTQAKLHTINFWYLENAREFLRLLYPDIQGSIDNWGGVGSFLYEIGNKELRNFEDPEIRLQLSSLSENIPMKMKELRRSFGYVSEPESQSKEALLEHWINGNDKWKEMAELPPRS